jgi:hypothetical protein
MQLCQRIWDYSHRCASRESRAWSQTIVLDPVASSLMFVQTSVLAAVIKTEVYRLEQAKAPSLTLYSSVFGRLSLSLLASHMSTLFADNYWDCVCVISQTRRLTQQILADNLFLSRNSVQYAQQPSLWCGCPCDRAHNVADLEELWSLYQQGPVFRMRRRARIVDACTDLIWVSQYVAPFGQCRAEVHLVC